MLQLTMNFTLNLAKATLLAEVMQFVNDFIQVQNETIKLSYWTANTNTWQCEWNTEQEPVNQEFTDEIMPYLTECKVFKKTETVFLKANFSELIFVPLLVNKQVAGMMIFTYSKENIVTDELKTIFVLVTNLAAIQLNYIQNIDISQNSSQIITHNKVIQQDFAGSKMSLKVLLVEDIPSYQIIISRFLKNLAIQTTVASTGQEALTKLKEQDFDLVLLDLQLPDIDGFMVATKARQELNFTNPIIAMTADNGDEIAQNIKHAGMNDLIVKPIQQAKLQKLLQLYAPKELKTPDLTFLQDAANDNHTFIKSMFKMTITEFEQFEKLFVKAWTTQQVHEAKLLLHKIKPHLESYKLEVMDEILKQIFDNQDNEETNRLIKKLKNEISVICDFFRKQYEMI